MITPLSKHFSLEELTFSELADRKGINNHPGEEVVKNLYSLAFGLEKVRDLFGGKSIRISSGFRCLALNSLLGSKDTSAHVLGFAADWTCQGFGSPKDCARAIAASDIQFDQLISEGSWVHLSFDLRLRGIELTAKFTRFGVSYTQGLPI